eukprot:jgi/Mesvir1/12489/Mv08103-RA.2
MWQRLATLEGRSRVVREEMERSGKYSIDDSKLQGHFDHVDKAMQQFEETLWRHLANCVHLGKTSPATLVRVAKVVELQEKVDEALARDLAAKSRGGSQGGGKPKSGREKNYLRKFRDQLDASVEDRFATLLPQFLTEDITVSLQAAGLLLGQLIDVYDYVVPCFPPRFELFGIVALSFHMHFAAMLKSFSDRAEDLSNTDILKVMNWVGYYQNRLTQYGLDQTLGPLGNQEDARVGLRVLGDVYIVRMTETMKVWCANILEADKLSPPKQNEQGRCWTPAPVDLFRILNEQIAAVQDTTRGRLLLRVGQAVLKVMQEFQMSVVEQVSQGPDEFGLEGMCAKVNNFKRSYELAMEIGEAFNDALDPNEGKIDFKTVAQGFLDVAKDALKVLCRAMFSDPGLAQLMSRFFESDWYDGSVTATVLETLRDYFNDFTAFLEEDMFSQFAEFVLEQVTVDYASALLKQKQSIQDATVRRMEQDEAAFGLFFESYVARDVMERKMQPVNDLRELASSDSVESFVLSFNSILQNSPGANINYVSRVLALRMDMSKADRNEVLEQCKEIYNSHLASTKGQPTNETFFSAVRELMPPQPGGKDAGGKKKGWFGL